MIVVGAGQAGLQVAESLRAEGFSGELTLLGNEKVAPYQRPPLSKAWLARETADDRLVLRGPEALAAKKIDLRLGAEVAGLKLAERKIVLADGSELTWTGLALATGARARRPDLPGADLPGVCVLRDLDDAREISHRLDAAKSVVIVGGGFIGLEVAAAARKRGCAVTLVEALDRLDGPRGDSEDIDLFRSSASRPWRRVAVRRTGRGDCGRGRGFRRDSRLPAGPWRPIWSCSGSAPSRMTSWRRRLASRFRAELSWTPAAAPRMTRSSRRAIARRCAATDGALQRFESVQYAVEGAKAAAAALMGKEKPFVAAPWFWSDQYDVKLQMAGLAGGHDRCVERSSGAEAFSLFYYRGDRLVAVDSVNRPGEHLLARRLLDAGLSPDPAQVADPGQDLRTLLR